MTDKKSKQTTDVARRIWLAGIGAYGKAFEEGRDRMKGLGGDISGKTTDAFETLAEKGERIEMAAKVKGAQLAGKASDFGDDIQSTLAIDDRIKAMRARLTGHGNDDRFEAIDARLSRIEAKLDALIKAPATKRTTTTRTKKAPAKTTTTKKTTATKKAPAKKATPKTTPTKKTS